jgi:hypothetical protein
MGQVYAAGDTSGTRTIIVSVFLEAVIAYIQLDNYNYPTSVRIIMYKGLSKEDTQCQPAYGNTALHHAGI